MVVPPPADEQAPVPAEEASPESGESRSQAETAPCPRCGAPYAATQEYCLECGLRLPVTGAAPPRPPGAIGDRLPGSLGEWALPVALAFVIAALGAGAAIAFASKDNGSSGALVATSGSVPTTVTQQTVPTTQPTTQPPTTSPSGKGTKRPKPAPKQGLVSWPPHRSGYTIILASIPTQGGRAAAVGRAKRALAAGLPQVGVLESSGFTSLHPGYYVIFSGIYASYGAAQDALSTAVSSGFADAYPSRIVP